VLGDDLRHIAVHEWSKVTFKLHIQESRSEHKYDSSWDFFLGNIWYILIYEYMGNVRKIQGFPSCSCLALPSCTTLTSAARCAAGCPGDLLGSSQRQALVALHGWRERRSTWRIRPVSKCSATGTLYMHYIYIQYIYIYIYTYIYITIIHIWYINIFFQTVTPSRIILVLTRCAIEVLDWPDQ
jgi:hypothetical protein